MSDLLTTPIQTLQAAPLGTAAQLFQQIVERGKDNAKPRTCWVCLVISKVTMRRRAEPRLGAGCRLHACLDVRTPSFGC